MQPYDDWRQYLQPTSDVLAKSCADSAYDQADRAHANRATDMGLIAIASLFSAAGLGLTTSSNFVSDTHNGGQPSDIKQWAAGAGAVSVGVGAALFGLRTALNLGELSTAQIAAASSQLTLAQQIHGADPKAIPGPAERYAQCMELSSKASSAYPGASSTPPVLTTK
jgi:hypothetical protein